MFDATGCWFAAAVTNENIFHVNFYCLLFVEYAVNGSLYNFLQLPQSEQLTFENTVQWAKDIARGKYCNIFTAPTNCIECAHSVCN